MHMRPWPGELSNATTKAVTVVRNQTRDVFLSLSKAVPEPPCLEPDNNSLMRPVTAEFLLFVSGARHNFFISVKACTSSPMSGTRQHFTDAACHSKIPTVCVQCQTQVFLSLSKPMRGPSCLEPDNILLMRPVTAEFLQLCLLTPLSALQDTVKNSSYPIAGLVQVMGDKAVVLSMDWKSVDCR